MDEDENENVEELAEEEEDLQAWCLLEESENEQWQEVISKRNKQKARKTNKVSLLSVESSQNLQPEEGCGDEGQMGEGQSHHGHWSCGVI